MAYLPKRIKQSELLQIHLLNEIFAQSGSEHVIFQGGTALRWIYSGTRFSEDLDFVTHLSEKHLDKLLDTVTGKIQNACTAQFGFGHLEQKRTKRRKQATQVTYIYRPESQRERIAVKLEFEALNHGLLPEVKKDILRDLPLVSGLIRSGDLMMPYSSSIVISEMPEEILSDKIRALYERAYIKGRDIYDIWFLNRQLSIDPDWNILKRKFIMYESKFIPKREVDFYKKESAVTDIIDAIQADLPRFVPNEIYAAYRENGFSDFLETLDSVISRALTRKMNGYFKSLS